ncbi:hypothetical protein [Celerinatantimonas diazotrophica]|uniref:Uncharacterized protein n=1 Tax=Celerinatantimonas diazotrophica TaxID=412034 RepID=A0A4R1JAE4_9GAMM|nr:hypothetical protein [Celerinatantimonas diazotrophica]TCK47615.1 hypothetical protein EV690_2652 [Celerinatantimonas diazotrophica]CAG9296762.1 hypothetical protein CEDIAZO_01919 [Celerinatantimonas diazotrophica]
MRVGGINQAPYPIKSPNKGARKDKKRAKKRSESGHDKLQVIDDDSIFDTISYDLPSAHTQGALRAYQEIHMLAKRNHINLIFGVDIYA